MLNSKLSCSLCIGMVFVASYTHLFSSNFLINGTLPVVTVRGIMWAHASFLMVRPTFVHDCCSRFWTEPVFMDSWLVFVTSKLVSNSSFQCNAWTVRGTGNHHVVIYVLQPIYLTIFTSAAWHELPMWTLLACFIFFELSRHCRVARSLKTFSRTFCFSSRYSGLLWWASAGGQNGHLPRLGIGTKNQKFLETLKSASWFQLI